MKTYLVDFENVKSKGLTGIDKLTGDDHVIIFYSENSDTISFEMHCLVMKTKAQVDYMKVRVGGKNALDFQLSTLLGYLVAKNDNTHLFIISNDKGFDRLHDFWENTFSDSPLCKVFRTANISSAVSYAKNNKRPPEPEEPETQTAEAAASSDEESAAEKVVEIEIRNASGDSASIDVPEAMVYSMIDAADGVAESIAPKQPSSPKPAPKKRGRKPKSEKTAKAEENTPKQADTLPDVVSQDTAHPMIAADKAHMAMYEPMLEEFLSRPGSKDKHALLAGFMEDVPDTDIEAVKELILASSSKLELHNMLMKQFDNDTSTHYYTMIKKNYYFLKRVLPEDAQSEAHAASDANTEKSSQQAAEAHDKNTRKKASDKKPRQKSDTNAKKAEQKNTAESKKHTEGSKPADKAAAASAAAKKVDAAMKRKLHELLDGKASPDEFSGIISVMNASVTSQQLYINLMQRYSKKRGQELYRIVKGAYAEFLNGTPSGEKKSRSSVKQKHTNVENGETRLRELTDGVIEPENFRDVYEAVLEANTVHKLYLGLIRRFGRSFGSQIYAAIKSEHEVIKSALVRGSQS